MVLGKIAPNRKVGRMGILTLWLSLVDLLVESVVGSLVLRTKWAKNDF